MATQTAETGLIPFSKYKKILLSHLNDDCINKIEQYYYSMFYYDVLIKIPMQIYEFNLTHEMEYHFKPLTHLKKLSDKWLVNLSTKEKKHILTYLSRYFLYNSDYIIKSFAYNRYITIKNKFIDTLLYNAPKWDMAKYYYERLTLKLF